MTNFRLENDGVGARRHGRSRRAGGEGVRAVEAGAHGWAVRWQSLQSARRGRCPPGEIYAKLEALELHGVLVRKQFVSGVIGAVHVGAPSRW